MTKQQRKEILLGVLARCWFLEDKEAAHIEADDALIAFIHDEEIKAAYKKIEKWYA